ncbi:MAG: hypothetical protein Q8K99_08790 [Actinomycetota bacterium]|nr:hypothetical protein [Actinomycetota bacterium]
MRPLSVVLALACALSITASACTPARPLAVQGAPTVTAGSVGRETSSSDIPFDEAAVLSGHAKGFAQYSQIVHGMTYKQVAKIMGAPNPPSRYAPDTSAYERVIGKRYLWGGRDLEEPTIIVSFKNGEVDTKHFDCSAAATLLWKRGAGLSSTKLKGIMKGMDPGQVRRTARVPIAPQFLWGDRTVTFWDAKVTIIN